MQVTAKNFELLRRLDSNGDGQITHGEAQKAATLAGLTRLKNEAAELSPADRVTVVQLITQPKTDDAQLVFGDQRQRLGKTEGTVTWSAAQADLTRQSGSQPAPLGTVGQERVGSQVNNDCGPAGALYMNDRRIERATGRAPERTQATADAMIKQLSSAAGTTASEMAGKMTAHFPHAGGQRYTFAAHDFTSADLLMSLLKGLGSDPGGVMVPIISSSNASDQNGTRHWLVITGIEGENVHYYDPAGPDGANHLQTMPIGELHGSLEAPTFGPLQMVYGQGVAESSVVGDLKAGSLVGQVDVRLMNRDLKVIASHGVYGDKAVADKTAETLAGAPGKDALVRREGNGFAVYAINEVRDQFGGLWSHNSLTQMDKRVKSVFMTDPTTNTVRQARTMP